MLIFGLIVAVFCFDLFSSVSHAESMEKADRIHKIIVGVRPTHNVRHTMADLIRRGDVRAAAHVAMEDARFYEGTLKNWASPLSNEGEIRVDLNDASATIIGVVRDDLPFTSVLTDDILYIGGGPRVSKNYSTKPSANREYYRHVEKQNNWAFNLKRVTQSDYNGISDSAGIITSHSWGQHIINDQTNRAVHKYILKHFMCREMSEVADNTLPDFRVRRDITRGGGTTSTTAFKTKCVSCHALMDGVTGAFSFFEYSLTSGLKYTPGKVAEKVIRKGTIYRAGHKNVDDSWIYLGNFSSNKKLKQLGWRGATKGKGVRSYARAVAESKGFSICMAKKVFKKVCLRESKDDEQLIIHNLARGFEKNKKYSLKNLFAETADVCFSGN